jgi:hypothetical protein
MELPNLVRAVKIANVHSRTKQTCSHLSINSLKCFVTLGKLLRHFKILGMAILFLQSFGACPVNGIEKVNKSG